MVHFNWNWNLSIRLEGHFLRQFFGRLSCKHHNWEMKWIIKKFIWAIFFFFFQSPSRKCFLYKSTHFLLKLIWSMEQEGPGQYRVMWKLILESDGKERIKNKMREVDMMPTAYVACPLEAIESFNMHLNYLNWSSEWNWTSRVLFGERHTQFTTSALPFSSPMEIQARDRGLILTTEKLIFIFASENKSAVPTSADKRLLHTHMAQQIALLSPLLHLHTMGCHLASQSWHYSHKKAALQYHFA